tara:strand:- start:58 stop:1218 length:1161 start_codon:yes stop_codon:yes gene_type:complete
MYYIFKIIKLQFIPIDSSRIGSFYYLDWYYTLKKNNLIKNNIKYFFFFYDSKNTANLQWNKMWQQSCYDGFLSNFFLRYFQFCKNFDYNNDISINILPVRFKTFDQLINYGYVNQNLFYKDNLESITNNTKPNIFFTKKEELIGLKVIKNLNLKKKEYVCFNSRDSNYLSVTKPNINFEYHNYRDTEIKTFINSINYLSEHNIKTIRMGKYVKEKLSISNKNFIEYSDSRYQTDFNDIYLLSNCKFLISSDCGITIVPEVFRVPIIYTNWTLLWRIPKWARNSIIIFKKLYSNNLKRFLNFEEMLLTDYSNFEIIKSKNLQWIDNSSEEIMEAVKEMNMRLSNQWISNDKDLVLQNKFWKIFKKHDIKSPDLYIGSNFLRNNENLL